MTSMTTCYACGKATSLQCLTPGCTHYFCRNHGDFICAECRQQSNQQQSRTIQGKDTQKKIAEGALAVLIALVIGIFKVTLEIIKAVFKSL